LTDGRDFDLTVIGTDSHTALAGVEIDAEDLKPIAFGDTDNLAREESDYEGQGFAPTDINEDVSQKYGLSDEQQGVVITDVVPSSIAERIGLKRGDVVLKLNRKLLRSIVENTDITEEARHGDNVLMCILRGDTYLFVTCEIPAK